MKKLKSSPHRGASIISLGLIILGAALCAFYIIWVGLEINQYYDDAAKVRDHALNTHYVFDTPVGTLAVRNPDLLQPGSQLGLVSEIAPLSPSYAPPNLQPVGVAHGDSSVTMYVSKELAGPLERLFEAAERAGYPLMASSGYRSIKDQQELKASYAKRLGTAMAERYVAQPGTSEHHTGLSVDLSDRSQSCADDSDTCGLSSETASWLKDNASSYGFILRYPEGKETVTGTAPEAWHYRYVGPALALLLSKSNLTLDEAHERLSVTRLSR